MQLEFVSREEYKRGNDAEYLEELAKRYPEVFIIHEGGSSQLVIQGCICLADETNVTQDQI